MTSTVSTLTDYAQQVLDVAETALATTSAGAPDSVFLSASRPAWDCCPFLAVQVQSLGEEQTSPLTPGGTAQRSTLGSVILATYHVYAVRCAAGTGNQDGIPTDDEKSATALTVQEDGWALWNGFRAAVRNGDLFDTCTGVHFDGGTAIPEQGGCVGWIMQMRAYIPGIPS